MPGRQGFCLRVPLCGVVWFVLPVCMAQLQASMAPADMASELAVVACNARLSLFAEPYLLIIPALKAVQVVCIEAGRSRNRGAAASMLHTVHMTQLVCGNGLYEFVTGGTAAHVCCCQL